MTVTISGNPDRDRTQITILADGAHRYRLEPCWGALDPEVAALPVVAGCCGPDDTLYLATRDPDNPIVVLDRDGGRQRALGAGLFRFLHGISVSPSGTLLCADADRHQIIELAPGGRELRRLGSGRPSDSGHDPHAWRRRQRAGDAIPMDKPFMADWAFYEGLKTIVRAAPPFNRPTAAAVAPSGDIYVSDGYGNAAVHRFAPDGTLLATWGGPGTEPGQFLVPHHLAVDYVNRVWVADREGNSVQVFSAEGTLLARAAGGLYQPTGVWLDRDRAYISERGGLTIIGMDFTLEAQLGYSFSGLAPHALCGSSQGDLYLFMLSADRPHNILRLRRCD